MLCRVGWNAQDNYNTEDKRKGVTASETELGLRILWADWLPALLCRHCIHAFTHASLDSDVKVGHGDKAAFDVSPVFSWVRK